MELFQQWSRRDVVRTHGRRGSEGDDERVREAIIISFWEKFTVQSGEKCGGAERQPKQDNQKSKPDGFEANKSNQHRSGNKYEDEQSIGKPAYQPGLSLKIT